MKKEICMVTTHIEDGKEIISTVYFGDYPSVNNGAKSGNQLTDDEIVKVKEFMSQANKERANTESIFDIFNEEGYRYIK